ncbi:hypothetical protein CYMTET_18662 [Cymbomonas tetramitiformis]|uniref:Uncharacterized protein n=1 Tax=Cymbomonas tetramitiformis TaxID=36881 RepID=A0AAE0G839_9CHLO|nr:hypothetical protein CYMTET_18662 [Cymbomonas tetramitiformis]
MRFLIGEGCGPLPLKEGVGTLGGKRLGLQEATHLLRRNSGEGEDVGAGEVLDGDLARQRANDLVSLRPSVQSIMDDIMKDMVEDQDNTDDPPEEDALELNASMLGDPPSEPPAKAHSGKVEEAAAAVEGAAAVAAAAAAAATKKVGGIGRGGPGRLSVVIGDPSTERRSSTMSSGSSDPGSACSDPARNRSGAVFRLPPPPSTSSSKPSASLLLGNPPGGTNAALAFASFDTALALQASTQHWPFANFDAALAFASFDAALAFARFDAALAFARFD